MIVNKMWNNPAYLSLKAGDTVPVECPSADRALFQPGAPRWHCLVVPAQRELQAEAWLAQQGVYAFHPVRHRTVLRHGKTRRIERRYLPGYVFARFPGPIVWHRVVASLFITDIVRLSSGAPGYLCAADLAALHAMRSQELRGEREGRKAHLAKRRRARPAVGQSGIVAQGPFAGQKAEVIEIEAGRARIRLPFFGRPVDVVVPMGVFGAAV